MTSAWSAWPAPAKLNLFLHIVGRRDDGYHLLQTLFQLLNWGDVVRLRVRQDGVIARDVELAGVPAESDLCLRAALLLRERVGRPVGADIAVDKHIPLGGGLGGGSSDAASVLVGLNELWRIGLSIDELADLGLELGADVPVFVRGQTAWAEGIGERLTPVALPRREYVIVHPRVNVSTTELFRAPELTRNSLPATISGFLSGIDTNNAFTSLVRVRYPQVAAALDWLGRFGDARMSGSGSCVFLATESVAQAERIASACPPLFAAYRASGVVRSPLMDALESHRGGADPVMKAATLEVVKHQNADAYFDAGASPDFSDLRRES